MKMFHGAVLMLIVFVNLKEIYSAPADVDNSKTVAVYNEYKLEPDGNYNYKYKLSDGQAVDVEGKLNDVGGNSIYRVKGFYTFEGTDGKVYTINYIADENGYKTGSENIPAAVFRPTPSTPPTRPSTPPTFAYTIPAATRPPPPPVKPGSEDEINPRTIAGTFG